MLIIPYFEQTCEIVSLIPPCLVGRCENFWDGRNVTVSVAKLVFQNFLVDRKVVVSHRNVEYFDSQKIHQI